MYCGVDEAFENNPLGQQLKELEREQYKQSLINSVGKEQRIYSAQNDYTSGNNYNKSHPFFTAQGDINNTKKESKESKAKDSLFNDSLFSDALSEELSFDTSLLSDKSSTLSDEINNGRKQSSKRKTHNINMVDHTHEYYIRNFIKDVKDIESLTSNKNDIYDHVKTCKYCKGEIMLRINGNNKEHNVVQKEQTKTTTENNNINSSLNINNTKEIGIMVLIGIVIIFLLDLFVKVSRIVKK
jgi:hypothetical protein